MSLHSNINLSEVVITLITKLKGVIKIRFRLQPNFEWSGEGKIWKPEFASHYTECFEKQ